MDAPRRSAAGPQHVVRLSDPGEIAAGLPQLLGFRPRESVVLVGLGGESGGRVGLTVRVDIPPPGHAAALAGELAARAAADGPSGVLVAIVSDAPSPAFGGTDLPHRDLVHELVLALADRDLPVRDALLVGCGRWWSYDCPHVCCAPGAGTPLPTGVGALEAASVVAGQVLAEDRGDLAARIAPSGDPLGIMAAEVLRIGRDCSARVLQEGWDAVVEESWAAVTEAVAALGSRTPRSPAPGQVARIVWGLRDAVVRDRALGLALGDDAEPAERLWTECTRRAPAPLDAAPATLLAVSVWLRGDGVLAGIALDRARRSDPGYGLALQLDQALAACVPPAELRAVIAAGMER